MLEKTDCAYYDDCELHKLKKEDMIFLGMSDTAECGCEVCDDYQPERRANERVKP